MYSKQNNRNFSISIKGKPIDFSSPWIMGILNLTPDSFYDGNENLTIQKAIDNVSKMIHDGADIIDIGAMSSRPFSLEISLEEELRRLNAILPNLMNQFPNTLFSIDTYRSEVAEFAINHGISIINDITAGAKDKRILELARDSQLPYIAMHMQGSPISMQVKPSYKNIMEELTQFFQDKLEEFDKIGLQNIILDPGFGFGKSLEDNYSLLGHLSDFHSLNCPLLVGISRKSMIYKPLEISPSEALTGTIALHFEALRQGANIVRVHDVKEAKQVVDLYRIYKHSNS